MCRAIEKDSFGPSVRLGRAEAGGARSGRTLVLAIDVASQRHAGAGNSVPCRLSGRVKLSGIGRNPRARHFEEKLSSRRKGLKSGSCAKLMSSILLTKMTETQ